MREDLFTLMKRQAVMFQTEPAEPVTDSGRSLMSGIAGDAKTAAAGVNHAGGSGGNVSVRYAACHSRQRHYAGAEGCGAFTESRPA